MADSVVLLGRTLPISTEPGAQAMHDQVVAVILAAADLLNRQFANGELSDTVAQYIGALHGLGVGSHRSFTPCIGTCDIDLGEFVFFIGADDVAANPDPVWYASTIIHDGGHAWLSQNGQTSIGVAVEQSLTQVQIDYYTKLGNRPTYISNLEAYIGDPDAIQARILQKV
jgi:hypothetical protein